MEKKTLTLRAEQWGPLAMAAIAAVYAQRSMTVVGFTKIDEVLSAVLNASAIFSGFIGTIWSILLSMIGTKAITLVIRAGYGDTLMKYLERSLLSMLVWTLVCGIGLAGDWKNYASTKVFPTWTEVWFKVWVVVGVLAMSHFGRVFLVFSSLLRYQLRDTESNLNK